ncbi:DNA helicase-2/ATP-dependent DNA helicase PcrA [Dyadobacter sp. BE34]|uniref:DNA 3'-5' helicase n=1 Tax=Dyadobacter fermentans TaxID=94254 RepID=A0ABU1R3I7_9BACT|nr:MULTISPECIES: UvrD-helicase domain-containing protein [Dyadobacter]MDR6807981.1 DNA helicase-2/ATP-dependent DNA helicase PcrA [Dyadobacter fermentans]MDR7045722.1 DNA helicase-2/ATP-dependent DNA helicase PcrA [Dyadobacter sp. BE242]MDR7200035.1 DNA helicase-2/ATP-dependent DNA helicase PcrA [Dyadobacter sp. BE34]MDR7217506.1 DNA helicase-2/ATP-dependent DNA helicase PcrA [Dyadobacter sp. BE31]MDR7265926.1 DNA helicase-2/ATP-dependent DNA helicase PcrA [Dyadobacter sp. BE32]
MEKHTTLNHNDYLSTLNEPQREAVLHGNGPLMIIAGAGSGKTRVLTYRIARLIETGVDPFRILSLTFTNKASGEMRSRIEGAVGTEARNIWMGTFHSVFAKILRIEARYLGYTSDFSIYDTDDSKSLLRSIIKEYNLDDKVYKANVVFNRISGAKNRLISPDDYINNAVIQADDDAAKMKEIGRLYKTYATRCFQANAMDFDDLLFNTNVLFRDFPDVLYKYQHKFQHVMVDEFQDTNVSQYLITRKLSAVHRNIVVVGDDAQSIYAFRGANIENILNFEKDFPDVRVIKLEQNYRSTSTIVNAANSVIARNKSQLEKHTFTSNEEGSLIDVIKAGSDNEEGRLVATAIFEEKMQKSLRNENFAILYRTNAQSRSFEEALRKLGIKYRIVGGQSFYQRKEIKDLLAYLRFTVNQRDEEAFKRIINLPKRGIGDTTVAKIAVTASENNVAIWDVVANINQFGSGRSIAPIEGFATLIKSFKILVEEGKDAYEISSHIAKASGILRELYEDKTVEGFSRYENVQELLNGIKEFVDSDETEDKSLSAFLQSVSLLTNADEPDDNNDHDRVTMMTIHSAKGLEFRNVFIVGLEEDLFPSQMMLESRQDLEEERRLFYVAITRAEKKLSFSYAESRYQWGRLKMCEPSRFLLEVDQKYLNVNRMVQSALERDTTPPVTTFARNLVQRKTEARPVATAATSHVPSADFVPTDTFDLAEGDKVEHLKFGFGVVTKMDVNGTDRKATVKFDLVGEKTLLLSFAKLRVLK